MYGFASGDTLKFAILYNPDQYIKPYPIQETVSSGNFRLQNKDIAQLITNITPREQMLKLSWFYLKVINKRLKLTCATTVPSLSKHKQTLPSYDFNIIWPPDPTDSSLILTTKQKIISLQPSIANVINLLRYCHTVVEIALSVTRYILSARTRNENVIERFTTEKCFVKF